MYTKQYLKLLIQKARLELLVMAKSALQYLTESFVIWQFMAYNQTNNAVCLWTDHNSAKVSR